MSLKTSIKLSFLFESCLEFTYKVFIYACVSSILTNDIILLNILIMDYILSNKMFKSMFSNCLVLDLSISCDQIYLNYYHNLSSLSYFPIYDKLPFTIIHVS